MSKFERVLTDKKCRTCSKLFHPRKADRVYCSMQCYLGDVTKFFVEGLPKSPNAIGRSHWAVQAKHKKEWAEKIGWLARAAYKGKPLEKATIAFHISTGDNRRHDPDNLAWAVSKVTLDAIKGIILVDDSIDNVSLVYYYSREKPRGFTVEVLDTPIT